MKRLGFSLIELMVAVLILALLASSVAMSFSHPIQAARSQDAIDQIRSFDAMARQSAVATDLPVRIVFDISAGTVTRYDGEDVKSMRSSASLPAGYRIDQIKIGRQAVSIGQLNLDFSSHGLSRSYSVHLVGAGIDQWLCFAGLTGQMNKVQDESGIPTPPSTPRYNTD